MALANVAAELSRRGKSVLIADFDLEAPGVSSISFNNCLPSPRDSLGIVDFVHKWLLTDEAPDISKYVTSCPSSGEHGAIWIMPAGNQDEDYGTKLQEIDWADLYANHDGYLLLEDLKRQWKAEFNPDYVLIDSRTGHTDIGGICTRQLPDLVTFVFWPNVQNLTGLQLITAEMDTQEKLSSKQIKRLFVPSNLPTIDDEDEVLKGALADFRTKLHYEVEDEIQIHNYQSIDFLTQLIFTAKRPAYAHGNTKWSEYTSNQLSLLAIGGGEFEFGIELLKSAEPHISTSFNVAMAKWGLTREIPKKEFEEVARFMENSLNRNANYEQCAAMVSIALGHSNQIKGHIDAAKQAASKEGSMFSCWSYLERRPAPFLEDTNELARYGDGEAIVPSVFSDAWQN